MIFRFERLVITFVLLSASVFLLTNCSKLTEQSTVNNNPPPVNTSQQPVAPPSPAPPIANEQQQQKEQAANLPFTLPVLDAMFAEENFPGELKSKLSLTDDQIQQLKETARDATAKLKESETNGSTANAKEEADEKIRSILGEDKALQLAKFVSDRWANGSEADKPKVAMSNAGQPNAVPTDTRVVVNAPAYRMDLFKDGRLVKTYKIGIGYPEFPLPAGMRQATQIIFNPTWTPPDEPWVKGKVKAGQKIEAGNALNPLGPIKIPIGAPSLIHGGKQTYKLGGFASHGCVGLTNPQVQDFSIALAGLSGTPLTGDDVLEYAKKKTETKNVKLSQSIPVELRYETIIVENGVLKIYRDVYERGTNTQANLQKVLGAYGVSLDSLNAADKTKITAALKQMAVDAGGSQITADDVAERAKLKKNSSKTVTRTIVGKKEIDIPLASLAGKGYPAPVDLNTGTMSSKPLNLSGNNTSTNSNRASQSNTNQTVKSAPSNSNSASRKF